MKPNYVVRLVLEEFLDDDASEGTTLHADSIQDFPDLKSAENLYDEILECY